MFHKVHQKLNDIDMEYIYWVYEIIVESVTVISGINAECYSMEKVACGTIGNKRRVVQG